MSIEAKENLHQKLASVGLAIGFLEKDSTNDFQKYKYASAAAMLLKVNRELFARNISVASSMEIIGEADGAVDPNRVLLRITLTFTDGDNPNGSQVVAQGIGCGFDKGDKAVMKAITAAHKYAYTTAFAIGWHDEDPEASKPSVPREEISPEGKNLLARLKACATLEELPAKDAVSKFKDKPGFAELKAAFIEARGRVNG